MKDNILLERGDCLEVLRRNGSELHSLITGKGGGRK